ncbi:type II toxin-antitoxin system Rv0910 family toxin [Actinoplanes sp. HUAS TT8]|uniref:type II toxin-antitoxin system Rv0910 family toxin n=1 Tax=Actinoplanes sp. HUAS TT8 TaxID=3447453 RepID=UPI003F5247B7
MRFRRRAVPATPPAEPATTPESAPPRRPARPWALSIAVPAPAAQVFAYLANAATMADWLVMHTGWPTDPPGALTAGARFRQRVKLMGTPVEVRWTVTAVEDSCTLWLDGTGPMGIEVGVYLTLSADGSGTTVRLDGGVQGGPTDGPLGPMVARNLTDALRKSLKRLAQADLTSVRSAPLSRPETQKSEKIRHERTGVEVDPWTPVLVGAGQISDRSTDPRNADPVSLAVRALRLAATDSTTPEILKKADTVGWVASVSWQYPDAAALIAEAVAAPGTVQTVQTGLFGGDGPLRLLNDLAAAITRGETSIALIAGAEAAATAAAAERSGTPLDWPTQPDGTTPTRTLGSDREPNNAPETAAGLTSPLRMYALIETAIRAKLGLTADEHRTRITRLWSRFSDVAATNPHAWLPHPRTPAELATPDAGNRPVGDPYTKLLTANLQVNQATGLILCSAQAAHEAGIPQDRWVFVHAGAHAEDEWFVTERADLAASPAIHAIGRAVLGHTGRSIDEIKHLDLYACFPSAVQIAADELGVPLDRQLTVTGGLTFAGGPGNNYASHAVANLVPRLRLDPDDYGLATALGWYLTKHAATVLSARPPAAEFRDIDAGLRLNRPARRVAEDGTGVLEAYTVTYHRDGTPESGIATEIRPDGTRTVRNVPPESLQTAMLTRELPAPGEPPVLVGWQGPITVIRLNRPEVRNAVDLATARALERAIDDFEADPDARVAVLTGNGPIFSAGMDLKAAARGEYPITEGRGLLGLTARPPRKPLIAAVEGAALAGGCELALAADLIVAAEDSLFGIPEVKRGLVAAAGGVLRLARSLPRATALEMALTGEPMPARRLHDLGLINRITAPGKAYESAIDLAVLIASHPERAVLLSKRIVDEHLDWSTGDAFDHLAGIAGEVLGSANLDLRKAPS